jgi:hypothetical protein
VRKLINSFGNFICLEDRRDKLEDYTRNVNVVYDVLKD